MTATSAKRPNGLALVIDGLLTGASLVSWCALCYFVLKWATSGPRSPEGEYIYAHVEHGGVTYFNAMQSTASHLFWPITALVVASAFIVDAAYGSIFRRRINVGIDLPLTVLHLAGGVIAIAAIYVYGHDLLNALGDSPFGPSNDDLSRIAPD